MKEILCSVFVVAALLVGCGDSGSESKYIGKWVNVIRDKDILNIESNGDSLIIRYANENPFNGMETGNKPAKLKDGMLQPTGGMEAAYTIDKATGNLTNGFAEYKRVN